MRDEDDEERAGQRRARTRPQNEKGIQERAPCLLGLPFFVCRMIGGISFGAPSRRGRRL